MDAAFRECRRHHFGSWRLAPARCTCSERVWHSLCRGCRKRDDSVEGWNARGSGRLWGHNQNDRKFLSNIRVTVDSDSSRTFDEATLAENGYGAALQMLQGLMRHTAASNSAKDGKEGNKCRPDTRMA